MSNAAPLVLPFSAIDRDDIPHVGGKGANLGVLTRAGFPVPGGFCVTTAAFEAFVSQIPGFEPGLAAMEALRADDVAGARAQGEAMRALLLGSPVPQDIQDAVLQAWRELGEDEAYAVRSSATAEDLPGASFAGQQDTHLNVVGEASLLEKVRACWASLYTDRAILYRAQKGFSHHKVALSVVVQRMARPQVSGILFTADPVSGHRDIVSIDAGFGLGEALVSGLVTADLFRVSKSRQEIVERRIADKALAILALPGGGTEQVMLPEAQRKAPSITDAQAKALAALGARVEAHYGSPQDIEWCIEDGQLRLLQARPITSLYPLGKVQSGLGVFVSFGHIQVMTQPISPFGRSFLRNLAPFGDRPTDLGWGQVFQDVGGRIYVEMSPALRHPVLSRVVKTVMDTIDPRVGAAVAEARELPGFAEGPVAELGRARKTLLPIALKVVKNLLFSDVDKLRAWAIQHLETLQGQVLSGVVSQDPRARLVETRAALGRCFVIFIQVLGALAPAIISGKLLPRLLQGRANPADLVAVSRGFEGNVTTLMDLAVGDLADLARPHPALREALLGGEQDPQALRALPGGPAFLQGLDHFMSLYGMRGPSEIDIGRPRFVDEPGVVLHFVAGALHDPELGGHHAHFNRVKAEGEAAGQALVQAANFGLLGGLRARVVARFVRLHRTLFGLREHPKFAIIRVMAAVRAEARKAGEHLVRLGRLEERDDCFYLTFDDLDASFAGQDMRALVLTRKEEQRRAAELQPPWVMTSEGQRLTGQTQRHDLPPDALVGLGASGGVVEGIARVIHDPTRESLKAGEVLVAPFTDPGWTPLFIHASGLIMEVGGMMTHGSVVAREYGLPAVVALDAATTRIHTGDRVRVNGDEGYVQVLARAGEAV